MDGEMNPGFMDVLSHAALDAVRLTIAGDTEIISAVTTSLLVSLSATLTAFAVGTPLGTLLSITSVRGREVLLVMANALMGLPPVVVGLVVYLLLSRSGPLGMLGLLFTVPAMIIAQVLLTLPIVIALAHRATEPLWRDYGDALKTDGARTLHCMFILQVMARSALVTVFLAAFGRAIAEVGAIMIVGGNIRGHTRTMTTSIALETSKGDLAIALGLGMILVLLTLLVSTTAFYIDRHYARP